MAGLREKTMVSPSGRAQLRDADSETKKSGMRDALRPVKEPLQALASVKRRRRMEAGEAAATPTRDVFSSGFAADHAQADRQTGSAKRQGSGEVWGNAAAANGDRAARRRGAREEAEVSLKRS